jgi:hypothetical protein
MLNEDTMKAASAFKPTSPTSSVVQWQGSPTLLSVALILFRHFRALFIRLAHPIRSTDQLDIHRGLSVLLILGIQLSISSHKHDDPIQRRQLWGLTYAAWSLSPPNVKNLSGGTGQ